MHSSGVAKGLTGEFCNFEHAFVDKNWHSAIMSVIMDKKEMKNVKIKPLAKLVLAKIDEAPSITNSGFYLPENATEKPKTATVAAIGPKVEGIKVGDTIIYESYSGTEIKHSETDFVLVNEEKILATVA